MEWRKRKKTKTAADVTAWKNADENGASQTYTSGEKTLHPGKETWFLGRAWIEVLAGKMEVNGRRLGAGQLARQWLTADAQLGGPLRLSVPAEADEDAVFRFSSPDGLNDPSGRGNFQTTGVNDPRVKQWTATSSWNQVAQSIIHESSQLHQHPVFVVAGSRNLGKSTFARILVNNLLNDYPEVAYLDSDLGQPEFTPPGLVSLSVLREGDAILGPPHMHQRQPERSYFLGELSPEADPLNVIKAVQALYHYWTQERPKISNVSSDQPRRSPLVVNTNGWIQGVGLEVLKGTLQILMPSDLVCLTACSARKNLPDACFWTPSDLSSGHSTRIHKLVGLERPPTAPNSPGPEGQVANEPKQWSSVELRTFVWLEFASRCLKQPIHVSSVTANSLNIAIATKLAERHPLVCSFEDIHIEVLHEKVSKEGLASVLNGAVVGLTQRHSGSTSEMAPCLGLGIVRGIDANCGLVYLLTDIQEEILQQIDTLQVGRVVLPQSLLETDQLVSPYHSFWSVNPSGSGAGVLKSRNTLKRASQQ